MTSQPQSDVTHYPEITYADRLRGPAGTLLGIRRHLIFRAMLGRGALGCYRALPCLDKRLVGDWPKAPKPLHPRDLCATIIAIGWERYRAAARPIRILGLLNKH
ncbi:MAG: hypothetical protein ACYTG0_18530 [Planctomycetota bacterium]|jgi:hypothetical protein